MTTEAHPAPEPYLPAEDADDEWLREAVARRRLPRLTVALAAVAVAAIAFMAGVLIEKNYFAGSSASAAGGAGGAAARLARFFGRGGGAAGGGATGGSGFAAAGITVGQVKVINGSSFYVTDTSGNTLKVVLTKASTLTAQKNVGYKTLRPGDTVTVRGQTTGGTVRATTIAIGTVGAGGFGGFGGRGGGAGPTGTSGASG